MPANKRYLEDIKSRAGAPDARNKKTKLDLSMDKEQTRKKMSKSAKKLWSKRKIKGWSRRIEQTC